MNRIVSCGLEEDLIACLADELEREYPGRPADFSRVALVFGGKRPALFLKKELAARLGNCFYPPAFFSMDEFIAHVVRQQEAFTRMPELEAAYLVYRLAKETSCGVFGMMDSFPRFYPWAGEILDMIEQLDLEDIKEPVLENLKLKAEIGYDVPEHINELLKSVNSIRQSYHRSQAQGKRYSRGMLYTLAADYTRTQPVAGFERIYFCGLFYLHRCEEKVISQLYALGQAVPVFQGAPQEWPVLKKTMSLFGPLPRETRQSSEKRPEISLYAGFDLHSQVGTARKLIASGDCSGLSGTAVVLPDPEGLVPLLSEVSSLGEDFNVSMGYPLKRSPVYSLFRAVCAAQESRDSGGRYYAADYLRVILHPLVKNLGFSYGPPATRILMHKTEELLRGEPESSLGGSLFVGLDEIERTTLLFDLASESAPETDRDGLQKTLSSVHGLFFRKWEDISGISSFAVLLNEVLDALIRHGMFEGYPLNSAAIARLLKITREFSSVPFAGENFPRQDIFSLFLDRLEKEAVAFTGSPLKGLQILGVLETRGLKFRNVIVLDANEQSLPKLRLYEPLIPREILVSLGINRMEKEEEIQRYMFRRLIAGAEKVSLIYRESPDSERSRFIEELIWEQQKLAGDPRQPPVPRADFNLSVPARAVSVAKEKRVLEYLSRMRYSASSVNTYLSCPLKFYYRYVLGLKEREDSLQDPGGADVGTFLHALLQETFSGFCGKKPRIDGLFRKFFFGVFEERFAADLGKRMKSDAFMVREVMRHRLEKFLNIEEARSVAGIVALEKDFHGAIALGAAEFEFKARIDRIDRLDDGSLLVLDYKTGGGDIPAGYAESPFDRNTIKKKIKSFQLPVYLYFASRDYGNAPSINAALYSLRESEAGAALKTLFRDSQQAAERAEAMREYLSALDFLLNREILNPEVPFSPDKEDPVACSYCAFSSICE